MYFCSVKPIFSIQLYPEDSEQNQIASLLQGEVGYEQGSYAECCPRSSVARWYHDSNNGGQIDTLTWYSTLRKSVPKETGFRSSGVYQAA